MLTEQEFTEKMEELNWTEKEISEILEMRREAEKNGITPPPLEAFVLGEFHQYYSNNSSQKQLMRRKYP